MKQLNISYEQLRPLIIWLGLTELVWIGYWLLSPNDMDSDYVWTVVFWITAMVIWLGWVMSAGKRGFFLRQSMRLSNLVGVVLVVAFAGVLFGIVPVVREGLIRAAQSTSDLQLVSIHVLRLLAIGSVIKYMQGQIQCGFTI